ncbi:hypothetical protein VNO77_16026 [Canavalia gladiata]|uniref:Uncharacterized protein n=1 Tax=Canavalia gladiata TaxID=3824 RepID=A0AAN9QRR5_CANGL
MTNTHNLCSCLEHFDFLLIHPSLFWMKENLDEWRLMDATSKEMKMEKYSDELGALFIEEISSYFATLETKAKEFCH